MTQDSRSDTSVTSDRTGRQFVLTRAGDVRPERVHWLWEGRIPLGALSLLAGREGLGKSTVAVDLAAKVTRGELDGELKGTPRGVLYIATEDSLPHVVVPRLHAARGDLDRVLVQHGNVLDIEGYGDQLRLPGDIDLLAAAITAHDVGLVVLDAATSVIDGSLDGDRDRQMRRALEPLAGLARHTNSAVLGIVHLGKAATGDTGRGILGSIAWSQVARSVLTVARNDDDGQLVMSVTKSNLAAPVPSLAARLVSEAIPTDDGGWASVGRIDWLGVTELSASELLAPTGVDGDNEDRRTAVEDAHGWLVDWLAMQGGSADRQDALKQGKAAGHSPAALRRAHAGDTANLTSSRAGFPARADWL